MYELQQSENQMTRKMPPVAPMVMGALVGAGIALLLAPATGKDARRKLGHTAKKIGGNANGVIGKVRHNANGVIGKVRQTINGIKDDARASVDRGVSTFEQTRFSGPTSRVPTG